MVEQSQSARIRALAAEGRSRREIREELGVSRQLVAAALERSDTPGRPPEAEPLERLQCYVRPAVAEWMRELCASFDCSQGELLEVLVGKLQKRTIRAVPEAIAAVRAKRK